MKRFYPIVISVFVLLFITVTSYAEEIRITASVDKTTVERGDYVRYTIGIHGAFDTDQPQLPPIGDFSVHFGPSVSTQTSIVNNVVSIFSGYTYGLAPKRTGKITIGPATLKYKGKTYKSNSINIVAVDRTPFEGKVGEQKKRINASERVFVELTTDKKEAYIYEQIIMSFKLYFQKGLPIDDLNYVPATTKSFLAEKLGDERRYEEVRNGLLYSVVELRTALFPVVSGILKIPPATFSCNIIIRQQRRGGRNSLFDEFLGRGQQRYPVERETDAIILNISPLPVEGKPKYFTGAVGTFTMDVLAKPTSVKVGDPITLSINVSGTGNIQTMGEPVLRPESADDFVVYPAEANTTITDREKGIKGRKLYSKVIEPQHDKINAIPAISFSYFDPKLKEYRTITHPPTPITVEEPDYEIPIHLALKGTENGKEQVRILTKDIVPIMSNLYYFKNKDLPLYKRPLFLTIIFIIPILCVLSCIYIQEHSERLQTDVSYARKRRAPSQVKKRILDTRNIMQNKSPSEFYSALDKTLTEYIANKVNLAPASITHDNVPDILGNSGVDQEAIQEVKQCLESCDHARFSTDQQSQEQMENTLNAAERIIKQLERQL